MSKSLVDLVDEWELYDEEKRLANASAKQAAGYQKQIEGEMLELMEAMGVDRAAAGTRRLELRGQTVPPGRGLGRRCTSTSGRPARSTFFRGGWPPRTSRGASSRGRLSPASKPCKSPTFTLSRDRRNL